MLNGSKITTRHAREKRRQRSARLLCFLAGGLLAALAQGIGGRMAPETRAPAAVAPVFPDPTPLILDTVPGNWPVTINAGGDSVIVQRSGAVEFRGPGWSSGEQRRP